MNCPWVNKDNLSIYLSIYLWTGVWYQTNIEVNCTISALSVYINDCVGSLHLHLYMAEDVLVCFHFATRRTICISMTRT